MTTYPEWFLKLHEDADKVSLPLLWDAYLKQLRVGPYSTCDTRPNTKPTNPKDRAASNRLDLTLFPMTAIIGGALAMTEGDCKYGGYNSRKMGVNVSVYVAALDRHKIKFYNGEWADEKTLVAHLDSMIACCAILRDGFAMGNIIDDRPPKVNVTKMLEEAEEQVKHLHELFPNGPKRFTEVA